jgi:hypothetical protein
MTLGIIVLTAGLLWGRINSRRTHSGRREPGAYAELEDALVEGQFPEFSLPVSFRQAHAFGHQTFAQGVEYHFHSRVGLLTIAPLTELPSAVELRVRGQVWRTYISARFAADAVAANLTQHEELDALPAADRPARLEDWEKSQPHHFRT